MIFLFIKSILNKVGFHIRSNLKWQRKNYFEYNEDKKKLFIKNVDECEKREKELFLKYNLQEFKNNSTRVRYIENLIYLSFLEEIFCEINFEDKKTILDVGVKNWSYVNVLELFFLKHLQNFNLHGIEIDPYRIYRDFHSRIDYLNFYVSSLKTNNIKFFEGDVLNHKNNYDIILSFFPFVFYDTHIKWGLLKKNFVPLKYFQILIGMLNINGFLLIVNQNEEEFFETKKILSNSENSIKIIIQKKLNVVFLQEKKNRYGFLVQKIL